VRIKGTVFNGFFVSFAAQVRGGQLPQGIGSRRETVKTVRYIPALPNTGLKPGVNEMCPFGFEAKPV
jgi:hypothetical protein